MLIINYIPHFGPTAGFKPTSQCVLIYVKLCGNNVNIHLLIEYFYYHKNNHVLLKHGVIFSYQNQKHVF